MGLDQVFSNDAPAFRNPRRIKPLRACGELFYHTGVCALEINVGNLITDFDLRTGRRSRLTALCLDMNFTDVSQAWNTLSTWVCLRCDWRGRLNKRHGIKLKIVDTFVLQLCIVFCWTLRFFNQLVMNFRFICMLKRHWRLIYLNHASSLLSLHIFTVLLYHFPSFLREGYHIPYILALLVANKFCSNL